MKKLQFSILLLIIFCILSCNTKNQCSPNEIIEIGAFQDNWVYANKNLGIKLQLPSNWYITTYQSQYQNSIPMTEKMTSNLIDKSSITLKDVLDKKNNREPLAIFPIFLVTSFSLNPVFEQNTNGRSSLGFCIANSPNQNEEKDIDEILKNTNSERSASEKTELNFGSKGKLKCIKTSFHTEEKNITKIIGIKNYGCYNLLFLLIIVIRAN